jgi:CTP synthase (UTP-ammonia lyase)
MQRIRIGVIGDFNPSYPLHLATNQSIEHAARALGVQFETEWLPTDVPQDYTAYHALWCSPGSPYRSLDGALSGVRYARENGVPFFGTCGGFQHTVLEYGRNVLGLRDATHAEYDPHASVLFVTPLSCSLAGKTMQIDLAPGSRAAASYDRERAEESYYCNFGLNPAYHDSLEAAGLVISGWDGGREARVVELPSHPFFVATLFVPQAKSSFDSPHPLIVNFCKAAMAPR